MELLEDCDDVQEVHHNADISAGELAALLENDTTPRTKLPAVPRTGVIYVMAEAAERGFSYGNREWANLGQGAPEVGVLPNGLPRVSE